MNTDRRPFLGALVCGGVARKEPASEEREFPSLLLELRGKWPGEERPRVVTHLDSRRLVSVDLEEEEAWGELNTFWDGERDVWGLGNDVAGYWKVERAFEMTEDEVHEGFFPVAHELSFDRLDELIGRRIESWA